jgi:DNA-binding NarL/FixJ family response regulator
MNEESTRLSRPLAFERKREIFNVIIADHQPVFRTGIANLLAAEDDIRIVSQPHSSAHLLNAVENLCPDVIILSSGFLPGLADIHNIAKIASKRQAALLMLTANTENTSQFIPLGVRGVFYRSVSGDALVEGVRRLARGGCYLQTPVAGEICPDLVGERVTSKLSRHELKLIAAIMQGFRNREIAARFCTTEQMIKNAVRVIYDKTGVSDRLELTLFVIYHRVLAQATASEYPLLVRIPLTLNQSREPRSAG